MNRELQSALDAAEHNAHLIEVIREQKAEPFYERERRALDAMERAIFLRSALAMLAGGLIALAVALAAWILL